MHALLDRCPDAILQIDGNLACAAASPASARVLGRTPADLVGRSLLDLVHEDAAPLKTALASAQAGGPGVEAVFRILRMGGEQRWIEARLGAVDAAGHIVLTLRDISTRKTADLALRVANLELNKLAGSDSLTEIANRRRFDQTLETECRRAARNGEPVTLLLIDVDRFKAYNDRYGHQAGDVCLKRIGGTLRGVASRTTDLAARIGGEEFALLLPGTDERDGALLAERVRADVAALALPHEKNLDAGGNVTVSIGCATARPTPDTLRGAGSLLVAAADRALYDAKRLGRNRVVAPALDAEGATAAQRLAADADRLARLETLRAANSLQPSPNLDSIARMAAMLLGMPMAFVALLDRDEVVVVGHQGMGEGPPPLPHGFGAQLLGSRGVVVVPTPGADPRFRDVATERGWAFLAAAPLLSGDGLQHVGALWVVDRQAREPLDEPRRALLSRLACLVVEDLDARVPALAAAARAA